MDSIPTHNVKDLSRSKKKKKKNWLHYNVLLVVIVCSYIPSLIARHLICTNANFQFVVQVLMRNIDLHICANQEHISFVHAHLVSVNSHWTICADAVINHTAPTHLHPTPGCSLPQHTMLLGELHRDAEVLVAQAVSATATSSCLHKKRKRGSQCSCPSCVHQRRSLSHIYQCLGEMYFLHAYCMSYPSFVELHEHLKQGIEACHEWMPNKRKNREIKVL
jgi:hypothetical protein